MSAAYHTGCARHFEGMTIDRAAALLERPRSTVAAHLTRARAELADRLDAES
jgi:DNA-directed RNA polymerase specialized sigma24 family protein